VTEVAADTADAAAPGPAPTAFSGVLGRMDAGTFEPVAAEDAGAEAKAPAVRATATAATATPPAREGFLIRVPTFHASKPIGWTMELASRLLMAATPPQPVERLRP
jgi:hypothetical protein